MNAYFDAFRRFFDFRGRSTRPQYWFFILFQMIALVVATIVDALIRPGLGLFYILVSLAHFIPSLSVLVRRPHDTDRSGWWILAPLAPFVLAALLILVFPPSASGGFSPVHWLVGLASLGGLGLTIALLVFCCQRGTIGPNRFGADPLSGGVAAVFGGAGPTTSRTG